MKISVFGLGYVGIVNIACLYKLGHTIIGCDVKPHKVDLLRLGKSTILEPGVDELIAEGVSNGQISATADAEEAVRNSDMALVCVGTPSNEKGEVNLNYILNTATDITGALNKGQKNFTVVFRSTIPPGTVDELILPEIVKVTEFKQQRLNVVFLPEFLREGNAVSDFFNGARVVVGINLQQHGKEEITQVFGFSKKSPLVFTNFRTAEFVKYVDNAYHATKVAFANEIYSIGAKLGVDVKKANEIFLMDDILNISEKYLRPGAPFGGSCLPKDSRAIIELASRAQVEIPFFKGLLDSNKAHQLRLLRNVLAMERQKILIYGLTFKQNTDDIRESPFLFLLKELINLKKDVKVFDPKLNETNLRIDFPEVVKFITNKEAEACLHAEVIVLNHPNLDQVLKIAGQGTRILNCTSNDDNIDVRVTNLFQN